MITVANRTETAARVKYAFDHEKIRIDELCAPERTLHIDSKVLEKAESQEQRAADHRRTATGTTRRSSPRREADEGPAGGTVAADGGHRRASRASPASKIQNVISVGMLSEGWDAKTVTHIMGLRAFTSQLLCEQVVGRGLRRTSYEVNPETGLFEPEYVNIFGVPFTFLPHEGRRRPAPPPPPPKTQIEPVAENGDSGYPGQTSCESTTSTRRS